jgi:hypothetical protein
VVHKDTWTWRVVADVNTLASVIELMHGGAVSTLEVPCIIGEDMYDALKKAQGRLAGAVGGGNLTDIGNAIFDMEALIVSNCLFTEILNPLTSTSSIRSPCSLCPPATVLFSRMPLVVFPDCVLAFHPLMTLIERISNHATLFAVIPAAVPALSVA